MINKIVNIVIIFALVIFSSLVMGAGQHEGRGGTYFYVFKKEIHLPWECGVFVRPSIIDEQINVHCDLISHASDLHIYFRKSSECNAKEINRRINSKDYQPYTELQNATIDGIWRYEAEFHALGKLDSKMYFRIVRNNELCMEIITPIREAGIKASSQLWN